MKTGTNRQFSRRLRAGDHLPAPADMPRDQDHRRTCSGGLIIWLCLAAILVNCRGDDLDYGERHEQEFFVLQQAFDVDVRNGLTLVIKAVDKNITAHRLHQRLALVESPTKNVVDISKMDARLTISIVPTINRDHFLLRSKRPLAPLKTYGVYIKDTFGKEATLMYIFRAHTPPRLVAHDLGSGSTKKISTARTRMRFSFDQPIKIVNDDAITIDNVDDNSPPPKIAKLMVDVDGKTLWVIFKRSESLWTSQKKYQLKFHKGLQNQANLSIDEYSIDFVADLVDVAFTPDSPLVLSTSSRSSEFLWHVGQSHAAEVYLRRENDNASFSLVADQFFVAKDGSRATRLLIPGLVADTRYSYLVRLEDSRSEIILWRGQFSTTAETAIFISEVMVNPNIGGTGAQSTGEYVELHNSSDAEISISPAKLSFESIDGVDKTDCEMETPLRIAKNGYALLVFSDFKPANYDVESSVPLYTLKRKTGCTGLANSRGKIVKIHGGNGRFYDRYGGFLWPGKKGSSIARAVVTGLDEEQNYCYCTPTPGMKNNSCG